jgi:hypothetical protein
MTNSEVIRYGTRRHYGKEFMTWEGDPGKKNKFGVDYRRGIQSKRMRK